MKYARLSLLLLLNLLFTGCFAVRMPDLKETLSDYESEQCYARVLKQYVNDKGQVDFEGLAKDREDLDNYVHYVAATPFSAFENKNDLIAHHINAYNALAMYVVLDTGIPENNDGFWKKFYFFYLKKLDIGGQNISLYAYENDIIRKLEEERVHFALNCMAVSCPTLPQAPFTGANLEDELTSEALKFFNSQKHLKIDSKNKTVYFSEILDFFPEDFLRKKPTLIDYANIYAVNKIPNDYQVKFIAYDWRINNSNSVN